MAGELARRVRRFDSRKQLDAASKLAGQIRRAMIYTARQLEDLHKGNGNGQLVLPYGARLTPLAVDWARARKVAEDALW